jgi:hypothetical protein
MRAEQLIFTERHFGESPIDVALEVQIWDLEIDELEMNSVYRVWTVGAIFVEEMELMF